MGEYQKGYFCVESNIYLNLITCEGNIVIPPIFQSYVLRWHHTHLLNQGMDRMDPIIRQNLHRPVIRLAFWKEVKHCDT